MVDGESVTCVYFENKPLSRSLCHVCVTHSSEEEAVSAVGSGFVNKAGRDACGGQQKSARSLDTCGATRSAIATAVVNRDP